MKKWKLSAEEGKNEGKGLEMDGGKHDDGTKNASTFTVSTSEKNKRKKNIQALV